MKPLLVSWGYVRGHNGHPANERCDVIAVQFSHGEIPVLYQGTLSNYPVLISEPAEEPLDSSFPGKRNSPKQNAFYISLVDGELRRHTQWGECQNRVAGRSRARFKKVHNQQELEDICKQWGVKAPLDSE